MNRTVIGVVIILIGLFWPQIVERIPEIPTPEPSVPAVIEISEPTPAVLEKVSDLSSLVTDEDDRLDLAIFNKIFSERVLEYSVDSQKINDVYVEAAKNVFGDSLRGKYLGYSAGLNDLMRQIMGEENHELTDQEKLMLQEYYSALAWSFVNN